MTNTTLETARQEFLDTLLHHGLLRPTGVPGVYGKGVLFEQVLDGINRCVVDAGKDQHAEVMLYPPIVSTTLLERTDYLKTFPHLAGTIHSFFGNERDHVRLLQQAEQKEDWTTQFTSAGLALVPAACYSVYPNATGTLPAGGRTFDIQSYCYRHEPSDDPARMQIFRMHEYVRVGSPTEVQQFRDLWLERSQALLQSMKLDARAEIANDPFFGRSGKMLATSQRDQSLKFELVIPITSEEHPTAVVSCNYHQDHFGLSFDIFTNDGNRAHSACVGFGLERLTLALFKTHGCTLESWPAEARAVLGL